MSGMPRKPFDKAHGRDYKEEYARYQGKPSQIANRSERNKARRILAKKGMVHKGDGKDVDHKHPMRDGGTNKSGNLRVLSASRNRGFPRNSKNNPVGHA